MSLQTPYTNEQMLRLLTLAHRHSNPNLLDNWYFADPINQRGLTEYSDLGYTIDRWTANYSKNLTVTVEDGGLLLVSTGPNAILTQMVPIDLTGKTICFSLLTDSGLYSRTKTMDSIDYTSQVSLPLGRIQVFMSGRMTVFRVWIYSGYSLKLNAAKLEMGTQQTLAYQDDAGNWQLIDPPPNKQQELAKCQRYFRVYRTETARPAYAEDCSPVMRADPTQSTVTINGVTYYVNSADL